MEVKGKIHFIDETQVIGTSEFKKRSIVITTNEQYPQMLNIEFVQDKTAILDNYSIGQDVIIFINLRGREWVNPDGVAKYFNTIQGWRITKSDGTIGTADSTEATGSSEEPDDLPF